MQTQKTSPLNVVYNAIRSLHEDLVNVSFYPGDYEILIETFSKFYITHYYFWITDDGEICIEIVQDKAASRGNWITYRSKTVCMKLPALLSMIYNSGFLSEFLARIRKLAWGK